MPEGWVVIGTQWGDEGKGKIVDLLTARADLVIRFGGGNNAGHTLVVDGRRVVLHLIPSGILHPEKVVVLGEGMVVDPEALIEERNELHRAGVCRLDAENLKISRRAHVVMPYHRILDGLREGTSAALGTTRRGIGPAYEDKAARRGIRMGDLVSASRLCRCLGPALSEANARIVRLGGEPLELGPLQTKMLALGAELAPHLAHAHSVIAEAIRRGDRLLFEGAQGVLLDIDHGTYPYVTSSSIVPHGVATGAGPGRLSRAEVVGVTKAYLTRVGAGPFPTEVHGVEAELLRRRGAEYGATTGRPRRCGWLDLVGLRYAVEIAGVSWLAVTKLDVLSGVRPLRVCRGYRRNGVALDYFPDDAHELGEVEPVLEELGGFSGDLVGARCFADLPDGARAYLSLIERETGVPVGCVSVGPGRNQSIIREELLPELDLLLTD